MVRDRSGSSWAARLRAAWPLAVLGLAGLASALIYLRALVAPYGLLEWWGTRRVSLTGMIGLRPGPDTAYVLALAGAFGLYGLALIAVRRRDDRRMWALVIAGALIFCLILLFLYPFEAADIFDDIIRGRMQALYHVNPFTVVPNQMRGDPFIAYGAWNSWPSTYGPLWELTAWGLAAWAGDGVVANVLTFKLVEVAAFGVTCVLIVMTLRRTAPARALFGLTLYAWNPLVLISIAGNGHNDGLMTLFLILGFYLLTLRRYSLAVLAETAGLLVKFIPALVAPVIVVAGLRAQPDWRGRLRFLGLTALGCGLLAGVAYLPYGLSANASDLARRSRLFTTSIPTLVRFFLAQSMGIQANQVVAAGALALTALWVAGQTWRSSRETGPEAAPRAGLSILLFFLLVTCLWFQPWYVIWVMALAPLAVSDGLAGGAVLMSAVAEAQLPLFYLVLHPGRTWLPAPLTDLVELFATLGWVWLYFGLMGLLALARRSMQRLTALRAA